MHSGIEAVFPAAVLLVARHGGVALHRPYGVLDPETRRRPTQIDSLFDLASVTKVFTATAFMTLLEAGRVTLDAAVADVLPEFGGARAISATEDPATKALVPADPAFAGQVVEGGQVTFRHLLMHTSGLAAWRSLYLEKSTGKAEGDIPLPHRVPEEARVHRWATIYRQYGFAYPPGQRSVYSDLGMIVLGEAIAHMAGVSLEQYIRQAILQPLGLTRTTFNPLAQGVPPERIAPTEFCAWRHRRCIGEVHDENAATLGGVAGHAGLFSTAWEVAVLGQAYLNGGGYGRARLLSPQTVTDMTRVQADFGEGPRGLGWQMRSPERSSSGHLFGPRSYGHTGYTGTSAWVDPERELVVVLLTNRVYHGRDPAPITDFRPRMHDAVVEAIDVE
jgi:CubicO group peptidase (beta-lactamase class C family)